MDLIHRDVLVFSMDRGILLLVDVNGYKPDDSVGKVCKPPGMLKEKGIAVYFQKENINTLDAKGEVMITIMA